MENPGAGRLKRSLFILIFLVFPLYLAFFGNRILFLEIEDKSRIGAENQLEGAINQIESGKNPVDYFSRYFNRIEKKLFSSSDPQAFLRQFSPLLRDRFADAIQVAFLDGTGRPVKELSGKSLSGPLAKKFFESYKKFLAEKKPLSETAQSFMKSALSHFIPVDRESHSTLVYCASKPTEQYVYFSKPYSQGMVVFFFTPPNPLKEVALQDQIIRLNRKSPKLRLCLARRGDKLVHILRKLGISPREVGNGASQAGVWKVLQESGTGRKWFDDFLLERRSMFTTLWVIGKYTLPNPQHLSFWKFLNSLPMGFLFLGVPLLVLGNLFPYERYFASVRVKLLGAFLYAVLVPLLIMGMTAQNFLQERRVVLENEHHQDIERSMMALDFFFNTYWRRLRYMVSSHQLSPEVPAEDSYDDFIKNFDKYRIKYELDVCRIYDRTGRLVFDYYDPLFPALFGGQLNLLPKFARGVFAANEEMFPVAGRKNADPRKKQDSPKVDALLALAGMSFSAYLAQDMTFGSLQCYLTSIPLSKGKTEIGYLAYFLWNRIKSEWNYLQKELPALERSLRKGSFFAWDPNDSGLMFPAQFRFRRMIEPHLERVVSQTSSYRCMLPFRGGNLLLTGIQGTRLRNFSVLCVAPDLAIQAEIRDLAWHFRFITIAIVGVSILVGFLLARLFLGPLGNLTQGLEAIANRDFNFVIPITARDELGHLAGLFNDTMEDLKDLEVAKTVQECLFPKKALTLGAWEICGSCLPASQVGGDYFDYFPIDEERAVIIIGDVSGHGVAAALVVAMAKAIINHPSTTGKPRDILVSLNTILFSILKRKKMMSCCLALFEHKSGLLTFSNAGQSYPILLGEAGAAFLELQGYPLGSTKNWKANSQIVGPMLNQTIFFYTDGLIEALDKTGRQIGYDRFLATLPSLLRSSAQETEKAIRAWHCQNTKEGFPDDDISLIVLQKTLQRGDLR